MYAEFDADSGRAQDAMLRLVGRANSADPEIFAGLVSTCRYCGLLEASIAAHDRAIRLDSRIRTSVLHSYFVKGENERVATYTIEEYPYIVPLALEVLGRGSEALHPLREMEQTMRTRVPGFVVAARALIEGNRAESVAAVDRVATSGFRDPEGLFYLSRQLAHLRETDPALALLERAIDGGYFCYPAMAKDPWLDSLRRTPAFTKLLRRCDTRHREAAAAFAERRGGEVLGISG